MPSLFTRIISGELPGHFALKNDDLVVFMTIAPTNRGHALVVPRAEIDQWIDVPADLSAKLFEMARLVGRAQRATFGCTRVGLVIAGFEVNHCHLHCIPADAMSNLDFTTQQHGTPAEDLAAAAAALGSQLHRDGVPGAIA